MMLRSERLERARLAAAGKRTWEVAGEDELHSELNAKVVETLTHIVSYCRSSG